MNNLNLNEFLIEFNKAKHLLDIKYCYACESNYVHSFKHHTCFYMTGKNKDSFNDLAIKIVLDKFKIILSETELTNINNWISESSSQIVSINNQ